MNLNEFNEELKKLGITLSTYQLDKLEKFYKLLVEWNNKINLTRIIDKEDVYLKHYYDSLTINKVIDLNEVETLCDVGSGAGFPGIVLKIFYPHLKITLVDSLQKRVNYLNEIIKELDLKDIKAIHVRGEDYKGKFDVVTSRAVARIDKLLDYTMHLVSENGVFIAMKGNLKEELDEEKLKKIKKKYDIEKQEEFYLPKENSIRNLLVIKNK